MYTLSGLGATGDCSLCDPLWAQCLHTCGCSDDLHSCPDVSLDCVQACTDTRGLCMQDCGGGSSVTTPIIVSDLPPGTIPTTPGNLPGGLAPPPGYSPSAATNWWRIGAAVAIGVVGLGIVLGLRRAVGGSGHAA